MSAFSIKRTLGLIVLNVCFPAKADVRLDDEHYARYSMKERDAGLVGGAHGVTLEKILGQENGRKG